MPTRLTAFAHLATHLGGVTVAMGELLMATRRDRSTYYEDHF
jgi:hypothetical protein